MQECTDLPARSVVPSRFRVVRSRVKHSIPPESVALRRRGARARGRAGARGIPLRTARLHRRAAAPASAHTSICNPGAFEEEHTTSTAATSGVPYSGKEPYPTTPCDTFRGGEMQAQPGAEAENPARTWVKRCGALPRVLR